MPEPTDLTVLQAREIVLDIAEGKGWVEERIRNKSDLDTLRLLRTIPKIREDLGDAVETYVDKPRWKSIHKRELMNVLTELPEILVLARLNLFLK